MIVKFRLFTNPFNKKVPESSIPFHQQCATITNKGEAKIATGETTGVSTEICVP
jgi:hypothetical protein